jgi:uncharacterized protein YqgQ
MNRKKGKLIILCILIIKLIILSGCTSRAIPNAIPPIGSISETSLSGISVTLINAEQDTSDYPIELVNGFLGSKKSLYVADRNYWIESLIVALSDELRKMGASIITDAPIKINFTLPEISVYEGMVFRFYAKVKATSNDNWTKTYVGNGSATTAGFGFVDLAAGRASTQTLYEVARAILSDHEFINQIKGRKYSEGSGYHKLIELKEMYDKGIVSQEEYERLRYEYLKVF